MSAATPVDVASRRGHWLRLSLLAVGAVAGHLAWFLLLSPDPWTVGFGDLGAGRAGWAAVLLLVEASVLVACAGTVRAAALRAWEARPSALVAMVAAHVLTATAVTARPLAFPLHLAITTVLVIGAWLALWAAALEASHLSGDRWIDRILDSSRTPWYLAGLAAAISIVLNRIVFGGFPHVPDEVVYLLQAQYLASGSLYLDLGGIPPAALDVISTSAIDGRWFGIFPVGWPLVLAAGVKVGLPWLVNPILTACVLFAAHGLVARVWDRRTANLACLLLAFSPWLLFLGSSLMAHTASILVGTLALRGAVEAGQDPRVRAWSLVGGTGLGVLVLIRPFEGVLVGLSCAAIVFASRRSVLPSASAWAFGVVSVLVGGVTLVYNRALTGRALVDPITHYFDTEYYPGSNRLGFGADVGNVGWGNDVLAGHGPLEALVNGSLNASLVQLELFGWAFGSVAVLFLAAAVAPRAFDSRAKAALGIVATLLVGYSLYWYSAADFGARYWSQMVVPLSSVTAALLFSMRDAAAWRRTALLASFLGMPVVVTMRGVEKYRDYRGMTDYISRLADQADFGDDLILIRGQVFSDYSPGLILNPPGLAGPGPLYFRWVEGDDLRVLREQFPDRRLWIVDGPSISRGQPHVAEGPLP